MNTEHKSTEEIFLDAIERVEEKSVKDMTPEELDEVMERNYQKLLEQNNQDMEV